MSASFIRQAVVAGVLVTAMVGAGVAAGSKTFSPDTTQQCDSDATCSTITQSGTGQALVAQAARNNGSVGITANPSATNKHRYSGVWGQDTSSDGGTLNVGVTGTSTNGAGILATSAHGAGLEVRGGKPGQGTADVSAPLPSLAVTGGSHDASQAPPPLIDGCKSGGPTPCTDSAAVFKVENNGAITVASCSGCGKATTITQSGRSVDAFAAREASPTIEDVGEGRIVAGRGYVAIDPAFAQTTDRSSIYLVMLTPEGPSRGLYVAERTPTGFAVRENPGGTSTLAFTYRIVAKPFDTAAQRLPAAAGR